MPEVDIDLLVPSPKVKGEQPKKGKDLRKQFRALTAKTPRNLEAEHAFLASKVRLATYHPELDEEGRAQALAELGEHFGLLPEVLAKSTPPVPGGVGLGFFYNSPFRGAFVQGTSLNYQIVCPTTPGGNVNTWLYLTTMNRAGRGIEAFVSYHAQEQFHFKVFDWARTDHWQIDCPFGALGNYLTTRTAHGTSYQTLNLWNSTYQISSTQWRNEALLWNRVAARWDLIYRFDYAGNSSQQNTGFTGSWGPIVETFQNPYSGTNRMGALGTQLISRNASGVWGSWGLLSATNASVRNDGQGFVQNFLDPNYAYVVHS